MDDADEWEMDVLTQEWFAALAVDDQHCDKSKRLTMHDEVVC